MCPLHLLRKIRYLRFGSWWVCPYQVVSLMEFSFMILGGIVAMQLVFLYLDLSEGFFI